MLEKLDSIAQKFDEITERLADPAVVTDQDLYKRLMKEHKNLSPVVEKYREYKQTQADYAGGGGAFKRAARQGF